ncbi:MAG: mercury resistance system transport protein MerF [Alphaproteobacteria bacterium]|nr:MAG: mercury resistance system transport protein MerF [Alphaproteobacteria bacterium]
MNTDEKPASGLLRLGIVGTIVAALCCFTPVLVVLFGAVGLAAAVGYLDVVLFPALGFFVALTLYALWRRRGLGTVRADKQEGASE